MKLWQVILFAILQGITEFLPVSSSGHLVILKNILGLQSTVSNSFDVMLHVGTLAAVCICYYKDIIRLVKEGIDIICDCAFNVKSFFVNKATEKRAIEDGVDWELVPYRRIVKNAYRKFALLVIVSTIPTGILGLLEEKFLSDRVSSGVLLPGIFLLITGLILLLLDMWPDGKKTPKHTTYVDALIIGTVQGFATLPGISRSGSTITAGAMCGLRRDFAIKYSFIMSIPAILGAAILKLTKIGGEHLTGTEISYYVVGMIISGLVGFFCIKTLIKIIQKRNMKYFAFYCFAVGMIAIISIFV